MNLRGLMKKETTRRLRLIEELYYAKDTDYVNTSSYDVIVMDIMMPILDGISALAQ